MAVIAIGLGIMALEALVTVAYIMLTTREVH